jgi:hypothetical protein
MDTQFAAAGAIEIGLAYKWVWLNLTAILLVSVAVISLAVHLLRRGALL